MTYFICKISNFHNVTSCYFYYLSLIEINNINNLTGIKISS
nr:MAG TPA_asm: hypothetical protein [Caudoviricetes sp.]